MERKHKNIMFDIESLGKSSDCVILSIGACAFDIDLGVGPTFYAVLSRAGQEKRRVEQATENWWLEQSEEARKVLTEPGSPVLDVMRALEEFVDAATVGLEGYMAWGNGADFDNAALDLLWREFGRSKPWAYNNSRCFRTLKENDPDGLKAAMVDAKRGTHHNAADDACWQAEVAVRLLRRQASLRRLADYARAMHHNLTAQGRLRLEQRAVSTELNNIQDETLTALREYDQPRPRPGQA